ncbi:methyltransferase domain-containing protein [Magnetovibrio sp.]|uniref:methyltransferase domain-containing protein n=1 Tax=Magnetovibrio sp. TaxID=2024836 RepID=UPI002F9458F7
MSAASPQAWDPGTYLQFEDLRLRPALDLLARVGLEQAARITDLGCGAGNVTPFLRRRWPDAQITALDSSAEMLARAKADHVDLTVTWRQADVRTWAAGETQDLIYSNAVLHWLDDHENLFPRLMGELNPGGVLAVQMPDQFAQPSHVLMRQVAAEGPWAATLTPLLRPAPVAHPGAYYDWLRPHAASLDIWQTTYTQVLDGDDAVLNWISSTALKPLTEALDDEMRQAFTDALGAELRRAYPKRADGKTLFAFQRLFVVVAKT